MSFASGADSALAYDTLKSLGREKEYQKIEGNATGMRYLAFAVFAPIGSLLATVNLALPYLFSSIVVFLSGLIAWTMVEPPRGNEIVQGSQFKVQRKTYHEIKNSLQLMFEDKRILWFVLFFSLVFLATRLGFWTYQPYMKMVNLPLSLFGVVFAFLYVVTALFSKYADRLEKKIKEKYTLFLMPALVVVSLILMSRLIYLWSLSFILFQQAVFGIHEPVLKNHLNRLTPSDVRATMLSVQSMVGNLVFAILAPFMGTFVDRLGLQNALLIFAMAIIIFWIVLWQFKKSWFESAELQSGLVEE